MKTTSVKAGLDIPKTLRAEMFCCLKALTIVSGLDHLKAMIQSGVSFLWNSHHQILHSSDHPTTLDFLQHLLRVRTLITKTFFLQEAERERERREREREGERAKGRIKGGREGGGENRFYHSYTIEYPMGHLTA